MFRNSVLYNESNKFQYTQTEMALHKYCKLINYKENNLILDIGSGTGNVTTQVLLKFIPKCNMRLVGVDKSKEMVDFSNENIKDSRITFRVLDISDKNEDNLKSAFLEEELRQGFNVVFSFFCLHWTLNYRQTYKNILSLMRPGGQVFTLNVTYNDVHEVLQSIRLSDKWQPYLKDVPVLKYTYYDSKDTISEFTNMMSEVGFQDIYCYEKQTVIILDEFGISIRDLVEPIDPYLQHIPQDFHSEYLNDVVKVFELFLNENSGLFCKMIITIATKPFN